jgi:HTH-type transcriptional regulator/antitoxin HipB
MILFVFRDQTYYIYRFSDIIMLEPELLSSIIRKHRKAAGLSQLQLAEMAGVGKTVVFDIEKGKETIQLNTLRKILRVLNIKVQLDSPYMNQILNNENS